MCTFLFQNDSGCFYDGPSPNGDSLSQFHVRQPSSNNKEKDQSWERNGLL